MGDIEKLIKQVLSELGRKTEKKQTDTETSQAKPTGSGEKIYRDEPILRTAAQMAERKVVPKEYREMRKLADYRYTYRQPPEQLFYRQGKFMEKFEDNFEYHGEFTMYYPTYQELNDYRLRGYFSWRTKVRHGDVQQTLLAYVFLYIYELLNQIGVTSAEEGFDTLRRFWTDYRKWDARIDRYMRQWLIDYVVYYNLDRSLLADFSDVAFDSAVSVLLHYETHGEDELFSAINTLSSYNITNSKFYKDYPQEVRTVACRVFARLSEYYEKNRKNNMCERLFGRMFSGPYQMFQSAVFFDRMRYEDYEYTVSDICKYSCKKGVWHCQKYLGSRGRNRELGMILKAVDCRMRQKYEYKALMKPENTTKILAGMIEKEIDALLEEKKKNAAPKIEIDLSKLQGIREASIQTREKLIVDEERTDETLAEEMPAPAKHSVPEPEEELTLFTVPERPQPKETFLQPNLTKEVAVQPKMTEKVTVQHSVAVQPEPDVPGEMIGGLNDTEIHFLRCLLCGEPYDTLLREKRIMLSVLVDSINEKLFDLFGDTVIIFNGDVPELLEDYIDELKGLMRL